VGCRVGTSPRGSSEPDQQLKQLHPEPQPKKPRKLDPAEEVLEAVKRIQRQRRTEENKEAAMLRKERRLKEEAAAAEVRLALEADGAISKEEGNSISNSINNSSSSTGTAALFVGSGSVSAPTDSAEVGQKVESNKLTMQQQSRIEDMKEQAVLRKKRRLNKSEGEEGQPTLIANDALTAQQRDRIEHNKKEAETKRKRREMEKRKNE